MRSERESRDSSGDRRISNTSPGCHHGRSAVLLICLGGQPCLVSFPCTVATPTNAEALRQVLSTQSEVESRSHVQVLAWPLPIPLPLPLALPMPIFPLPPSPSTYPELQALPVCELRADLQSPSSLKSPLASSEIVGRLVSGYTEIHLIPRTNCPASQLFDIRHPGTTCRTG
jgi:hypothetical protein